MRTRSRCRWRRGRRSPSRASAPAARSPGWPRSMSPRCAAARPSARRGRGRRGRLARACGSRRTRCRAATSTSSVGTAGSTTLSARRPSCRHCASDATEHRLRRRRHPRPARAAIRLPRQTYVPALRLLGAEVDVRLERHGFYAGGGGRIVADVQPLTARARSSSSSRWRPARPVAPRAAGAAADAHRRPRAAGRGTGLGLAPGDLAVENVGASHVARGLEHARGDRGARGAPRRAAGRRRGGVGASRPRPSLTADGAGPLAVAQTRRFLRCARRRPPSGRRHRLPTAR